MTIIRWLAVWSSDNLPPAAVYRDRTVEDATFMAGRGGEVKIKNNNNSKIHVRFWQRNNNNNNNNGNNNTTCVYVQMHVDRLKCLIKTQQS